MEGVVPIELNYELYRLLERYADKKGLSVEQVVEKIVLQYLRYNAKVEEARILSHVVANIPETR